MEVYLNVKVVINTSKTRDSLLFPSRHRRRCFRNTFTVDKVVGFSKMFLVKDDTIYIRRWS